MGINKILSFYSISVRAEIHSSTTGCFECFYELSNNGSSGIQWIMGCFNLTFTEKEYSGAELKFLLSLLAHSVIINTKYGDDPGWGKTRSRDLGQMIED